MKRNFLQNFCLLTDSYKCTHAAQYPQGTQTIFSYLAARKGAQFDETVFFGLQYFLQQYLEGQVFDIEDVNQADAILGRHFGKDLFNYTGWRDMWRAYNGRLPVVIRAVPEGTVVPVGEGNVLLTIQNTDPRFFWLTNYLETLLVQVWYASTVATQSRAMKKIIMSALEESGDPYTIDFKLHDFGFRGTSCPEEAAIGGAAHLVNFKGTDTLPGIMLHRSFYDEPMAGYSVPASEHSTMTSWGEDHEYEAMGNMLEAYPSGIVACVSDSFDIFRACEHYWGARLKDMVLARDGVLVIRPDSGEAVEILPKLCEILASKLGFSHNQKGFRVLNPKVRLIQGDGVDIQSLQDILHAMLFKGWSADNLGFGSGGGLLRKVHRDTQRFAMKASWALVNGQGRNVMKNPVTDRTKTSVGGRISLYRHRKDGSFFTGGADYPTDFHAEDMLEEVFRDGQIVKRWTLGDIRERARL